MQLTFHLTYVFSMSVHKCLPQVFARISLLQFLRYYSFPQTFCMLFGRVWKLRVCKTFNSPFPITANPRLPRFLQETWPPTYLLYRSEERRVGKECRAGGETMH